MAAQKWLYIYSRRFLDKKNKSGLELGVFFVNVSLQVLKIFQGDEDSFTCRVVVLTHTSI